MNKLKKLFKMITSDESKLFINAQAYTLLVGIAPFLIIIVAFFGTYIVEVDALILIISRYIPQDLVLPFVDYISASQVHNLGVIVSLLSVSIWVGSKSVHSFMLLNNQYQDGKQTGFRLRIVSLLYFIAIVALLGVLIYIVVTLKIKTPLVIVPVLIVFLMAFYKVTSARKDELKDLIVGSTTATMLFVVYGQLFFTYINAYSNYNSIYGPLASIVILMISSWFIAWILFFGYSVNYVLKESPQND